MNHSLAAMVQATVAFVPHAEVTALIRRYPRLGEAGANHAFLKQTLSHENWEALKEDTQFDPRYLHRHSERADCK
jgi:hypothetical protein